MILQGKLVDWMRFDSSGNSKSERLQARAVPVESVTERKSTAFKDGILSLSNILRRTTTCQK